MRVGLIAAQNVAHAGRFKLEHAAGEALREDLVSLRRRRAGDPPITTSTPRMSLDQLQRVVDDVERGQTEKIHLEKRQLLEADHVVLR